MCVWEEVRNEVWVGKCHSSTRARDEIGPVGPLRPLVLLSRLKGSSYTELSFSLSELLWHVGWGTSKRRHGDVLRNPSRPPCPPAKTCQGLPRVPYPGCVKRDRFGCVKCAHWPPPPAAPPPRLPRPPPSLAT